MTEIISLIILSICNLLIIYCLVSYIWIIKLLSKRGFELHFINFTIVLILSPIIVSVIIYLYFINKKK
jgi:hypothetical protein